MTKTVMITGASNGFGYLTAVKCAEKGFRVIATMRNMKYANRFEEEIQDPVVRNRIIPRQLDVTDHDSLRSFQVSLTTIDRVDVLINNAGFAVGGFAEEVPVETYRKQFETNFFGMIAVTQMVLPIMRKQGFGKVLNVSSISGQVAFPGLSPYVASKHAVEGFTESLRLELQPYGIDAAVIQPGSFRTNIWTKGTYIPEEARHPDSPYADYMKNIKDYMEVSREKMADPALVATFTSKLAERSHWRKVCYPIGKGVRTTMAVKRILPWKAWERLVLRQLSRSGFKVHDK
ncbi:NADP-dependent 3-hydroxy acid dehydrogenase YdfG [Thalassobacillus cyri]|uniref:NADP-dependent 3-hydroxy acid dehydrogenase YdfG n=1 Tax=Thalassobacillus cyri TaxID=571932 RepID=A0A1H4FSX8_9BACI|nr:SDR family oxidoreductase [Thalassobacillus cyri]SEA99622.1 NADP-dependent 3-hydroxy acid dehydrogenase YdfG [Thalassobacillus cyri]